MVTDVVVSRAHWQQLSTTFMFRLCFILFSFVFCFAYSLHVPLTISGSDRRKTSVGVSDVQKDSVQHVYLVREAHVYLTLRIGSILFSTPCVRSYLCTDYIV